MSLFKCSIPVMGLVAGLASAGFAGSITFTTIDPSSLGISAGIIAYGINNAGEIVGQYVDASGSHVFLDDGGTFTTIDPSALGISAGIIAYGINNAGEIVGYYVDGSGATHGFLDNGGTFTTINDPLATVGTQAYGINAAGEIVGQYVDASGSHVFLDIGGTFTTVDPSALGVSAGIIAYGINDTGEIVGSYVVDGADGFLDHGFLDNGGTFTTINDPAATSGTDALGINDSDQIVGQYVGAGGSQVFLATPTASSPEPATLAMTLAAFLGMAGCRPRKRLWRGVGKYQGRAGNDLAR